MTLRHFLMLRQRAESPIDAGRAAEMFGERLFQLDPALLWLFRGERAALAGQIVSALVRDEVELAMTSAAGLSASLAGRDLRASHYETIAEALAWTLRRASPARSSGINLGQLLTGAAEAPVPLAA